MSFTNEGDRAGNLVQASQRGEREKTAPLKGLGPFSGRGLRKKKRSGGSCVRTPGLLRSGRRHRGSSKGKEEGGF